MVELDSRMEWLREFEGFDWISSDVHFGHKNQAMRRGIMDCAGVGMPDVHDERIIENWNAVVGVNDTVIVLGDIYLGRWAAALENVARLNGIKHLIAGNHDHVHPMLGNKRVDEHLEVFETVSVNGFVQMANRRVMLSHFPYVGEGDDHTETPRFVEHRLPDNGDWLIHGHTHLETQRVHGHQVHVGLDAHNLTPVSLSSVINMIRTGH